MTPFTSVFNASPDGVLTAEVGVITGELELRTSLATAAPSPSPSAMPAPPSGTTCPARTTASTPPATTTPCTAYWSTSCNDLLPPDQHHEPRCQQRSGEPEIPRTG